MFGQLNVFKKWRINGDILNFGRRKGDSNCPEFVEGQPVEGAHHARPGLVELLRPEFPRLSSLPIARLASAMCNGHNLNPIVGNSIYYLERKAVEEKAASAVHEQRLAFRLFRNGFDPVIELGEEGVRSGLTSFEVPLPSGLGFFNCVRMENNGQARHQRPRIFRRASLHETTRLGDVSRSLRRRAISCSHCPSASVSTVTSRLSSSDPAMAARASGGSFNASSSNFVA